MEFRSNSATAIAQRRQPRMNWHDLGPGHGVLEIDYGPSNEVEKSEPPASLELELLVWWGGGEPSRAVWIWSQTGRVAGWADVGEA